MLCTLLPHLQNGGGENIPAVVARVHCEGGSPGLPTEAGAEEEAVNDGGCCSPYYYF